jgi:replicative DNA helicase
MANPEFELCADVLECCRDWDAGELRDLASDCCDTKARYILGASAEIIDHGEIPTVIAVSAHLASMKIGQGDALRLVGGDDFLFTLIQSHQAHRSGVSTHKRLVREGGRRRRVREALKAAQEKVEKGEDVDEILAAHATQIEQAAQWDHGPLGVTPMDAVKGAMEQVKQFRSGEHYGIPYGFRELDKITGGIGPGEVCVLSAHTGHGKTSLALQVAVNVAREAEANIPVLYFSGEMLAHDLWLRVGCAAGSVNMTSLRNCPIESDLRDLFRGIDSTVKSRLWVHDSGMQLPTILGKIRRFAKQHPGGLIVIDHLDHISGNGKEGRAFDLHNIVNDIKGAALRGKVAVMLLAQFNRGQSLDEKPTRRSLKGASSIEQIADQIILIHRLDDNMVSQANIIVDKNRRGRSGVEIPVLFETRYTRFSER